MREEPVGGRGLVGSGLQGEAGENGQYEGEGTGVQQEADVSQSYYTSQH